MHTHTPISMHTHTLISMHTHTLISIQTHTPISMHTHTYTCAQICGKTLTHTYTIINNLYNYTN